MNASATTKEERYEQFLLKRSLDFILDRRGALEKRRNYYASPYYDFECSFCKQVYSQRLDDHFFPEFQNQGCKNCGHYLLRASLHRELHNNNSQHTILRNTIVCNSCIKPTECERYDCKMNTAVCTCKLLGNNCRCCKICKEVSIHSGYNTVGKSDKCFRCKKPVYYIYRDYLTGIDISNIHNKTDIKYVI